MAIGYFAVVSLLGLWSAFWVVRLAVRYGVNDAIRMNHTLFERDHEQIDHP